MSKMVVTGATGFLGMRLALRLRKMGFAVTGIGRNEGKGRYLRLSGIEFVSCDLAEKDKLSEVIRGADCVFHCAAKSSLWGSYESFFRSNVEGTATVAEQCLKHKVRRLIHVSSPSIYFDFRDRLNIRETEPLTEHPANNYIKTKIQAEKAVDHAHFRGLDVITLRPRGIFGSGDSAILPRLLKANREKFIPRTRTDDILADLTHVDNVVEALILAMQADKCCSGHKYNITNDENVRLYGLLEKVITDSGEKFNCKYVPYGPLLAAVKLSEWFCRLIPGKEPVFTAYSLGLLSFSQTLDITRAKEELGYRPIISVTDGLKEALNG